MAEITVDGQRYQVANLTPTRAAAVEAVLNAGVARVRAAQPAATAAEAAIALAANLVVAQLPDEEE